MTLLMRRLLLERLLMRLLLVWLLLIRSGLVAVLPLWPLIRLTDRRRLIRLVNLRLLIRWAALGAFRS